MAEIIEGNKLKLKNGTVITLDDVDEGIELKSDYTRKTQALADERKRYEGLNLDELKAEAQRAGQWDVWYESNKGNFNQGGNVNQDLNLGGDESELTKQIKALEGQIKELKDTGTGKLSTLEQDNKKLERALRYTRSVNSLRFKHSKDHPDIDFDEDGILKKALEYGKSDLNDQDWDILYNDRYREDFDKLRVDRLVKEKLGAEKEKEKASRITDGDSGASKTVDFMNKPTTFTHDAQADALRIVQQRKAERGEI